MSFPDLDEARKHHSALRDLFLYMTGGRNDRAALARVRVLCRAAARAVDDAECREKLEFVRMRAADMFSNEAHLKWERNSFSGVYVLRLQILGALDAFNVRLDSIEEMRGELPSQAYARRLYR